MDRFGSNLNVPPLGRFANVILNPVAAPPFLRVDMDAIELQWRGETEAQYQ